MSQKPQVETNFGNIEGAARYLGQLLDAVDEARADLKAEALLAASTGAERREQAIQLATYKLSQLQNHLTTSHRLLNDLRTIRRLLFAERQVGAQGGGAEKAPSQFVTAAESPAPLAGRPSGVPASPTRLDG